MCGNQIKKIKLNDKINFSTLSEFSSSSENISSIDCPISNISVLSDYGSVGVETFDLSLEDSLNVDGIDYSNIAEDGFIVQGYTIIDGDPVTNDGRILITAYDKDKLNNSRIYIYNSKNGVFEGKIILNNKDHVGGVTMDSINQILYVTGSEGKVNTYDYKELSSAIDEVREVINGNYTIDFNVDDTRGYIIKNDISVSDLVSDKHICKQDGMDSVYFYNGFLYSNTYSGNGDLVKTKLNIIRDSNGNILEIKEIESDIIATVGGAVQGLAFYNKDDIDYLVTASSSLIASSKLSLFEVGNDGSLIKVGASVIEHNGLEGINIDDAGNISGIFEYDQQEVSIVGSIEKLKSSTDDLINTICLEFSGAIWDIMN